MVIASARGTEPCGDPLDRGRVDVAQRDAEAVAVQAARDSGSEATPRARNDRDVHDTSRAAPIAPPRSPSSASR